VTCGCGGWQLRTKFQTLLYLINNASAEALTTRIVIEYIILFIYLMLSKQGTIIVI
jgi:hypothetical protein